MYYLGKMSLKANWSWVWSRLLSSPAVFRWSPKEPLLFHGLGFGEIACQVLFCTQRETTTSTCWDFGLFSVFFAIPILQRGSYCLDLAGLVVIDRYVISSFRLRANTIKWIGVHAKGLGRQSGRVGTAQKLYDAARILPNLT